MDQVGDGRLGIAPGGLVAPRERLHEPPDHVRVIDDRVLADDHDELVIGGDADVLHVDHVRVLVELGELDRLVVPERADGGVDAARQHRRDQIAADVGDLDRARGHAGPSQDRLEIAELVRDAGVADALAAQLGRARNVLGADRHDRRERPLHDRGDRHQRQALVSREQDLGLVGDRGVDLARGQQLERVGRVGRHLDVHVEARLGEVAFRERLVDPDVVGVREPVEHQRQLLRAAGRPRHRLLLLPAAGGGNGQQRGRERRDEHSGERAPHARRSSRGPYAHGSASRSASASNANSEIANSDRTTTAATVRAASSCGWETRIT